MIHLITRLETKFINSSLQGTRELKDGIRHIQAIGNREIPKARINEIQIAWKSFQRLKQKLSYRTDFYAR